MLSSRLIAALAISMFAIACSDSYTTPTTSPTPVPSPTPSPGGPTSSVTIPMGAEVLGDRAYSPDVLEVTVGTTVTWRNTDSVSHTSTSSASGWNSGIIAAGRQFSFAFQTAGTFPYHCSIHPGMVGTVVVR